MRSALLLVGLVLSVAAIVAGVALEFGAPWALIVGGLAGAAGCLLIDDGKDSP
jgi:hypothetical protein